MKKCLNMLNDDNFTKLTDDPTKSIKRKIQRAIRRIKSKLLFLDVLILRNGVLSRQQFTVNLHVMMFIYTWIRFHLTAGK